MQVWEYAMSAASSGIGPVSVRYAAQIQELLYSQTMKRMAAEQEAARAQAQAEQDARVEAAAKARETDKPVTAKIDAPKDVQVDVKVEHAQLADPVKQPAAKKEPAPHPEPTAQVVDVHA